MKALVLTVKKFFVYALFFVMIFQNTPIYPMLPPFWHEKNKNTEEAEIISVEQMVVATSLVGLWFAINAVHRDWDDFERELRKTQCPEEIRQKLRLKKILADTVYRAGCVTMASGLPLSYYNRRAAVWTTAIGNTLTTVGNCVSPEVQISEKSGSIAHDILFIYPEILSLCGNKRVKPVYESRTLNAVWVNLFCRFCLRPLDSLQRVLA